MFQGLCPRKGRVQGNEPLLTPQNYRAVTYTAAIVIGYEGVVKCSLYQRPMNDQTFKEFCLETEEIPPHARNLGGRPLTQLLPRRSYIVWDRLGRSGRCKEPIRMHYNPEIRRQLKEAGVEVIILPPKGHLLNPEKVFHASLQDRISRWNPPGNPKNEFGRLIVGPRSFKEAQVALSEALAELGGNSSITKGCYEKRAYGQDLLRRLHQSKIGKSVLHEREEVQFIHHWPKHEE